MQDAIALRLDSLTTLTTWRFFRQEREEAFKRGEKHQSMHHASCITSVHATPFLSASILKPQASPLVKLAVSNDGRIEDVPVRRAVLEGLDLPMGAIAALCCQ